ncbi:hypothetical protein BAUCODRAFT_212585 [Baudoinia panamericana UAMH 10762]|uniref:Beta-lactamase-related domain-containing protein n=1 Tax=Baudoinia panamericana (strain UAMH 10762) TaxID=717646 RepID=M2LI50_BAUPA|nr:uncharacterized protein BAUCODRAFT_212585 [Baudoinia panamericana UAMH 10762]EMC93862.1 hypothetical protein BAUCODRAFT_212585 [Baudoinia panamericana UAMH 10762]
MPSTKQKLESTLAEGFKDGKIPHAIVCATNRDGSFTYTHTVGTAQPDSSTPIEHDAMLLLASSTKLLTSIAALQIVEKGLWKLDDDVSSLLPELCNQPLLQGFDEEKNVPIVVERKGVVTLRHLVTHTHGQPYDVWDPKLQKWAEIHGRKPGAGATVQERFNYPFTFEPGTSWQYSGGLDWTGLLIERLTGTTLDEYFKTNLFAPLGIHDMTFWPYKDPTFKDKVPQLMTRTPEGKLAPFTQPFINTGSTGCFGGHGCYGTMRSYNLILKDLLSSTPRLLKPDTLNACFTPQLSGGAKEGLQGFFRSPFVTMVIGEWRGEWDVNWGLGGVMIMHDCPDGPRRKAGTLSWGGITNTFWTVDREAGLAVCFGTQVLPPGDGKVEEMITAVEKAVYEMAGTKVGAASEGGSRL